MKHKTYSWTPASFVSLSALLSTSTIYQPLIQVSNWPTKPFQNQAISTETRSESAVWLEFSKNHFTLVTLEQIWRSYIFRSKMALQSVIKIDHTLSISISIWVVDQSLAHDQQKVIKRSNRSRSAIDHHKSVSEIPTNWRYYLQFILTEILTNFNKYYQYQVLVGIQISKWNMRFIIQTRLEKGILFFWKCAWSDFHEGMKVRVGHRSLKRERALRSPLSA